MTLPMKFLCGNCKAKYQIADEKVAGRTLRMTCRRCKEEIVIHGEPAAAPQRQGHATAHAQAAHPPPRLHRPRRWGPTSSCGREQPAPAGARR